MDKLTNKSLIFAFKMIKMLYFYLLCYLKILVSFIIHITSKLDEKVFNFQFFKKREKKFRLYVEVLNFRACFLKGCVQISSEKN